MALSDWVNLKVGLEKAEAEHEANREQHRHNLAVEAETNRSNLVKEGHERAKLAQEAQLTRETNETSKYGALNRGLNTAYITGEYGIQKQNLSNYAALAQTELVNISQEKQTAMRNDVSLQVANINAATSKQVAKTHYDASVYSADLSYKSATEGHDVAMRGQDLNADVTREGFAYDLGGQIGSGLFNFAGKLMGGK